MIVISRYTCDGIYEDFAAKLRRSCQKFGLDHDISPIPDRGSWAATDCDKPQTMIRSLLKYRRGICWLDADCEIVKFPRLLIDPHADFACYNWHGDSDNPNGFAFDPTKLNVSGGVLYFRYTAAALELLLTWDSECDDASDEGSDPPLNRAFNLRRPPVNALWLPRSYNRMDSLFSDEPIINHVFRDRQHKQAKELANV